MNKIELIKTKKDGLKIKSDIHRFAKEGWESISEEDIQRLKWYGLFLRNPTPGFFMLRVRIPNGLSFSHQVKALSSIAETYGNGKIDITTRQQVQLRHLKIENIPEVFRLLEEVGLTSSQTGMDNVRNIMGCPVAGLSPKEKVDAHSQLKALNEHIIGNPEFTNLPRKFNITLSGCPDDCVHAETQDLALVPAVEEKGGNMVYGFNVLVGGKLGSGGYRNGDETAKLIMIFWCLFAFIGSGYEHSIANQSLMSLALLIPHGPEVSLAGFLHNQVFVTAGNMVGGGVMVGMVYVFSSGGAFASGEESHLGKLEPVEQKEG